MRVEFRVGILGLMCTNGGLGPPVRGFPVVGEGGRTGKTGNKFVSNPGNAVDCWDEAERLVFTIFVYSKYSFRLI